MAAGTTELTAEAVLKVNRLFGEALKRVGNGSVSYATLKAALDSVVKKTFRIHPDTRYLQVGFPPDTYTALGGVGPTVGALASQDEVAICRLLFWVEGTEDRLDAVCRAVDGFMAVREHLNALGYSFEGKEHTWDELYARMEDETFRAMQA